MKTLPRSFYERDARVVARALIGCFLVREVGDGTSAASPRRGQHLDEERVVRIVETEAYRGPTDAACHARAGLTRRTRTLLGPPAHAYVFFVYGMHDCFNVVCLEEGRGHAVLVRAGEPVRGIAPGARTDGPGRLAAAMGITRADDGRGLLGDGLYLSPRTSRPRIGVSARVGVGYAGDDADVPWRFFDPRSACVSRPPRKMIGRG